MKDFVNAFKTFTDLISKYLVLMKQKRIQHIQDTIEKFYLAILSRGICKDRKIMHRIIKPNNLKY